MEQTEKQKVKYKLTAQICGTVPHDSIEQMFSQKRCFMGVSLSNPAFYDGQFCSIIDWINIRFSKCLIVIGDYLNRHNAEIFDLSTITGYKGKLIQGNIFKSESLPYIHNFPKDKFVVKGWKEILTSQEYCDSRKSIDQFYFNNDLFRNSVNQIAKEYISRQLKKNIKRKVSLPEALSLSTVYLLEEIAVFDSLVKQGWNIEVYPGQDLPVLRDIIHGIYPDAPETLKGRVNIELNLSRKG